MTAEKSPVVPYWHLWTDEEGVSRQTSCTMAHFDKGAVQPTAAPQWLGSKMQGPMTCFVTVLPVGWTGDWHENPKPQWIVPLSGRWFVEAMDGQRVEMGPGELAFGEDQNTRATAGRKGHRSGTVGDAPAVLLIVQFDGTATPASPCRFS
jgi:hypothetical protein